MLLWASTLLGLVDLAARKGWPTEPPASQSDAKQRARLTGIRGETYAYWYLRRHGYIMVARNFTAMGLKGEIDLVGYDGPVLAFVEVKNRPGSHTEFAKPEEAVTLEKRRHLFHMANSPGD